MADLDHPAPRLFRRIAPLGIGLRVASDDMRDVAVRLDDLQCTPASISGVCAQVFAAPCAWGLALDHDGPQHGVELRDVMLIGSCHDERQRDATAVHQQVSLAPLFFSLTQSRRPIEELDTWLRRRLRSIVWRQWKRPKTRESKLRAQGLDAQRA
jgi:hypothetical protein